MPKHSLHPFWTPVIVVLALLSLVQWALVLPLASHDNLLNGLNCQAAGAAARDCAAALNAHAVAAFKTRLVPLSHDFFFIEWNLLPLPLAVLHLAITRYYDRHLDDIRRRFGRNMQANLPIVPARVRDNFVLVVLLLILLCTLAIRAQFSKEANAFHLQHEALYWWDSWIDDRIWFIRLVFLVPNIVLVGLVLWEAFWGLQTLANVTKAYEVVPRILDPLRCFGMQCYGMLLLLLISPWFLAFITAILELEDNHAKQGWLNTLGASLMGVLPIYGLYLIAAPLWRVRRQLETIRSRLLEILSAQFQELEGHLVSLAGGDAAFDGEVNKRSNPTFALYCDVLDSATWPLPRTFGLPTLASLVAPFFGLLGVNAESVIDYVFFHASNALG